MKKKLTILLLVIALVVVFTGFSISGCKTSTDKDASETGAETTETEEVAEDKESAETETAEETAEAAGKPFEGARVTIASPSGRMAEFMHVDGQAWAEANGVDLEIVEIPGGQIFEAIMTEMIAGSGAYDIVIFPHYMNGDIMGGGFLLPIEDYILSSNYNGTYEEGGVEWDSYIRPFNELENWYIDSEGNSHVYSLPTDGDVHFLSYRKDLWIEYNDEFMAEYGYELRPDDIDFPEIWDQYYDIAEFFNNKDVGELGGEDGTIYGQIDINIRDRSSVWHFLWRYATYLQKDNMLNGDIYFDAETMEPLINNPAGVKAMEDVVMQASEKYSPPAAGSYGWAEMQELWQSSKLQMEITWPAMQKIAMDPSRSVIPGMGASTAASKIPGTLEAWDIEKGEWVTFDEPKRSPVLAWGWQFAIVKDAKFPEAAYDLARWMTTGHRLTNQLTNYIWEYEPLKEWQFDDPESIEFTSVTPSYLPTLKWSLENGIPDLRIPGTAEMYDSIGVHKSDAIEGVITPQEAVDNIAADWKRIIETRGLEMMKMHYIESITPKFLEDLK